MSIRELFSGDRGGSAAQDAASMLAGIALPLIERFGSDNEALNGLDDHAVYPLSGPEPVTRASVARSVVADGVLALEVVRVLENSLAACKAGLVDRVLGAVAVESAATGLSRYQAGVAETGCVAEVALALVIPERTAAAFSAHAVDLQGHPRTRAALGAGVLSWRHAVTILNEMGTLGETPGVTAEDAAVLEGRLLVLAEGATALRFASKARRERELMFPESLEARTKQAFRARRISNDPGKDGMNWLELHIPTIAANAIMVHCTRAARAIKADAAKRQRNAVANGTGEDCTEYRTLDQLRADVAAILLMGQELPGNARYATPDGTTRDATTPDTTTPDTNTPGTRAPHADMPGHDSDGRSACNEPPSKHPDTSTDSSARNGNCSSAGNSPRGGAAGGTPDCGNGGRGSTDATAGWGTFGAGGGGQGDCSRDASSTQMDNPGMPGAGVGFVPFGENSAFGVTLIQNEVQIEPPWAHGVPETPLQLTTGQNREVKPDADTGTIAGDGPGSDGSPRSGPGAENMPVEGTVVPFVQTAGHCTVPGSGSGDFGTAVDGRGDHGAEDPVEGLLLGDGSGYVDGTVDGLPEKQAWELMEQEAYMEQLVRLGGHPVLAEPPMPKSLVLVKVPFLGLVGITDEPAELDENTAGPVPLSIARRLLAASSTFLRVLTDPISGQALPMEPDRYTLKDAERSVLQSLAGGCYFPNCTEPVVDADLDHVRSFWAGGRSSMDNLRPGCRKHHAMKHFRDDKNRKGRLRRWDEPWREGIRLRGWTPRLCDDGRVGWVSPSGTYHPPECTSPQRPAYPKWLKKCLAKALNRALDRAHGNAATPEAPCTPTTSGAKNEAGA